MEISILSFCLPIVVIAMCASAPLAQANGEANTALADTELKKDSANGGCPKGYVRNANGRCQVEGCMSDKLDWLDRPVTMSCHFHWFLLIFAAIIICFMACLVFCNLLYEMHRFWQRRQQARYCGLSGSSSFTSSSMV